MRKRSIILLFLGILVATTTFVFFKSADSGASRYSSTVRALRQINEGNANLDSAVLSLRLGLTADYDELTDCERELKLLDPKLLDEQNVEEWERQIITQVSPLIQQKTLLTTDFKASHSVVRNSVAGFGHHIRRAQDMIGDKDHTGADAILLANLETYGSRFVISGDHHNLVQFERAIERTEDLIVTKYPDSRSVALALRHARKLVELRISLDESISRLVAVPIKQTTMRIMDHATIDYQKQSRVSSVYRVILSCAISVLVAFCLYQFFSLLKHKAAIVQANRTLEQRVEARTGELEHANRDLEHAISEAKKLALVARYTDNAVVITDACSRIEWVNDGFTRITGYTLEEVEGRVAADFLNGPDTDPEKVALMKDAYAAKQGFDVRILNYDKIGRPFWASIEARPIRDRHGKTTRFITIESDITEQVNADRERQRLNEQLVDASRTAGMAEVATGVLHNVGNILNSVNISASIIHRKFEDSAVAKLERMCGLLDSYDGSFQEFVTTDDRGKRIPSYLAKVSEALQGEREQIGDEIVDLVKNVEHIKDIVAVQQSMAKSSGVLQPLNPNDLIDDALTAIKGTLANHHIDLEWEPKPTLPAIMSDKHKILQVLINLIKNAKDSLIENECEDPRILIKLDADSEFVAFQISDNGIGIPEERINKIFQHGFTTKASGHGFGLHGAANFATELGGSLRVSSDGEGCGATFILTVPHSNAVEESTDSPLEVSVSNQV